MTKTATPKTILTLLRTVRVAAQPAITTSGGYFKEAGVVWMGDNFRAQFLNLKVGATNEVELAVHKVTEASFDTPILAELGDKAEISVSEFWAFLAESRKSSEWFVFYLKGKDGNLWAVNAYRRAGNDGWRVYAYSVDPPRRWLADFRVVSPN